MFAEAADGDDAIGLAFAVGGQRPNEIARLDREVLRRPARGIKIDAARDEVERVAVEDVEPEIVRAERAELRDERDIAQIVDPVRHAIAAGELAADIGQHPEMTEQLRRRVRRGRRGVLDRQFGLASAELRHVGALLQPEACRELVADLAELRHDPVGRKALWRVKHDLVGPFGRHPVHGRDELLDMAADVPRSGQQLAASLVQGQAEFAAIDDLEPEGLLDAVELARNGRLMRAHLLGHGPEAVMVGKGRDQGDRRRVKITQIGHGARPGMSEREIRSTRQARQLQPSRQSAAVSVAPRYFGSLPSTPTVRCCAARTSAMKLSMKGWPFISGEMHSTMTTSSPDRQSAKAIW